MATEPIEPIVSEEAPWEAESPPEQPATRAVEADIAASQMSFGERKGPWRVRHLMYLVAAVAVILWAGLLIAGSFLIGSLILVGGVVLFFAVAMGSCMIFARRRSTQQDALLSVLAIAAEREMPLAPAVAAFADQYGGRAHAQVLDLVAELNWGRMLPEALEHARKVVSRTTVLFAWVGQAAGMLPRALRMAATSRSSFLPMWTQIASRLAYILLLLLAIQTITGFVLYFIIPKFEAIFRDFGVALPAVTIWVIEASHFIIRYGYPFLLLPPLELILLIALPLTFLSWGNFHVPFFDYLLSRRHTALILRCLSLFVEGDKPISLGLTTLANHYPIRRIQRRLQRVAADVSQGADWIGALWRRGLIRASDADVLVSAAAVGNLAWALSELAITTERRLATRFQAAVQTLFPLVVLMLGIVIFILCMAHFMPLVHLIARLAD